MPQSATAAAYRRFAENEAHGRSPLYEALALGVAGYPAVLELLADLPPTKRQPNLLFAAARHVVGVPPDFAGFCKTVLTRWDEVRGVILARSTQTNEPGRCAVLLPVLAQLPQPLALIEVGASAGLCLLPDHYGYDYGDRRVIPAPDTATNAPVLSCAVDAATPVPDRLPVIAWRAGLDLNPLDVGDPDQMAWLQTLVWPEQRERAERLQAAIGVAAARPPRMVRADLRGTDLHATLAALAAEAPVEATLVIFHTAVLAYVEARDDRAEFARLAASLGNFWISNEAPGVFPDIASRAGTPTRRGEFLLAVNGVPVAWTDPHGASMRWIADPPAGHVSEAASAGLRPGG